MRLGLPAHPPRARVRAANQVNAEALASDPSSKRRNETIKKIKKALAETHQLMMEVPRNLPAK
jgi:hypothetical protein